jgi:hypothetical protein
MRIIHTLVAWIARRRRPVPATDADRSAPCVVHVPMEGEQPRALPTVMSAAAGGLTIRCRDDAELAEALAWTLMAIQVAPAAPHGLAWRPTALVALEARFLPRGRLTWAAGTRLVGSPPVERPAFLAERRDRSIAPIPTERPRQASASDVGARSARQAASRTGGSDVSACTGRARLDRAREARRQGRLRGHLPPL